MQARHENLGPCLRDSINGDFDALDAPTLSSSDDSTSDDDYGTMPDLLFDDEEPLRKSESLELVSSASELPKMSDLPKMYSISQRHGLPSYFITFSQSSAREPLVIKFGLPACELAGERDQPPTSTL